MRTLLAGLFVVLFSTTALAELVDNSAYQSWAACKPGSSVTYKTTVKMEMEGMEGMTPTTTVEQKLVSITPEHAEVSFSTTMTMAGQTRSMPGATIKIPAKIEKETLAAGDVSQLTEKPKITDMKESKEALEVKGKKVETTKYEFTMEVTQQGQTIVAKVKNWVSKDVPGGMVKMEKNMDKPVKMTNITELADYNIIK